MTSPVGHQVPNVDKPRVPYITNFPGTADQILQLDGNAQPAWADSDSVIGASAAADGEVLTADGLGASYWHPPQVADMLADADVGGLNYSASMPDFSSAYVAHILMTGVSVGGSLNVRANGVNAFDYIVEDATTPALAAGNNALIPLPTIAIAPSQVSLVIHSSVVGTVQFVSIQGMYWYSTPAILRFHAHAFGTVTFPPDTIALTGTATVANIYTRVIGKYDQLF